ncbi:serine hydrolase [Ascidiimonas aurantiaca]|uniref:serine hydrolase domain-containing protein n=1 Tax=Ascidiimonas aurantiaca TaxID=1685432 RepID=UPI0030EF4C39
MKHIFHFLTFLVMATSGFAQHSISKVKQKTIDSLLEKHNGKRPGYALGIVQNGELVYSKGYGKANLDYDVGISDSSAFYIGSMAKQFTAAALLILESEGKLDLKKPVTDYLSDFPIYDHEITVEHLVHHTGGIRETNSLQLFQGIDRKFEEVFDTNDIYNLVKAQKELNFKPGSEYRYSSGGYAVLAKMIEEVSGQPLRTFLQERVFDVLEMKDTFVSDNHNEIVPNRAVSYWPIDGEKYERRSQVFDAYGDGGIITTVQDLAKWDSAFYNDLLGVPGFSEKMYQKGVLNNGNQIDYALALNVWEYKGQKVIQHNGGMLGFRVDMVRFPKEKTTVILLGNSAYLDPTGDALKVAEIVLDGIFKDIKKENKKTTELSPNVDLPIVTSKKRTGYYWTDQMNYYRRISFENDSLFLDSGNSEQRQFLLPVSQNEYILPYSNGKTKLHFDSENDKAPLEIHFENVQRIFRKFDATPPKNIEELNKYVGVYESKELNTVYTFINENDKLYLHINYNQPIQIYPVEVNSNIVWNGKEMVWIGFGEIKFEINEDRVVNGFSIGDQRVSGVYFKKIK